MDKILDKFARHYTLHILLDCTIVPTNIFVRKTGKGIQIENYFHCGGPTDPLFCVPPCTDRHHRTTLIPPWQHPPKAVNLGETLVLIL